FYGQDRYYTNGLMLYFRHATDQNKLGEKLEKFIYEVTAGQKIFNPQSGYVPNLQFHDRPFAGYLYAGASANFFYKKESILKTSLELGTVGPRSLGEDGQKLLHKIVGFYELKGWEYQIKNELTANLSVQYTKLLHRSEYNQIDFSLEGYANVGTTFNGAGAGILMRTGNINQLFQTAYTNSTIGTRLKSAKLVTAETFFYAKPQLNFVAYDGTIQGTLLSTDKKFEIKKFVFAQQLGFNYSSQRFTFDFGLLFKTKEVKDIVKSHQYGTISMFYRFN
ncbi:MAG: lipid A deacylase LpxR family protein, partial [Pedobacter sp.]|nr:lipid A deacylase LpxR family protein [Pedobacter sp.]